MPPCPGTPLVDPGRPPQPAAPRLGQNQQVDMGAGQRPQLSVQLWPREKGGELESDHAPVSTHGLSLAPLHLLLLNGEILVSQDRGVTPTSSPGCPICSHMEATSFSSVGGNFPLTSVGWRLLPCHLPLLLHTVPSTSGYLTCDLPFLKCTCLVVSHCLCPSVFSQVVSASVSGLSLALVYTVCVHGGG